MHLFKYCKVILIVFAVHITLAPYAQVYQPDLGNGKYKNPIIHADYSDPDVVRVGDDYFMVSSSFNCVPGLPLLHSKDLVNWTIVNNIIQKLEPAEAFDQPQHGNGVWAPSIRYHAGWYYVFYGDPDYGIYMCRTRDPWGTWEPPHLVRAAKGWIDACPFWDDDGNAYLVHAFAGSRAGIKSILVLHKMSPDGMALLDDGVLVFDGHKDHPTIEGSKMYKRNGYYYIFAPGGGVEFGWQTVLRSRNIYGPYEDKIVLSQNETEINGPHQGAWIDTPGGDDWFVHFQDKGPYGRVVHLQPARWIDDWIVMGEDKDGDGNGSPVITWTKPDVGAVQTVQVPQTSDEFNVPELGPQWQWHANPKATWVFPTGQGFLRMNPVVTAPETKSLWSLPNLLLQKFPAEAFTATTKMDTYLQNDSEKVGLVVMGLNYASLALQRDDDELFLVVSECKDADKGSTEKEVERVAIDSGMNLRLQVVVGDGGKYSFRYSSNDGNFQDIGPEFTAREGKWIGTKVGLYSIRDKHINDGGYTNVDWFKIETASPR